MGRDRVVYLDHCALLSGAELALARLLPALTAVEPLVILAADGPLVEVLRSDGLEVEILPLDETTRSLQKGKVVPGLGALRAGTATAGYAVRLASRLRQLRPDLVVTNSLKSAVYGSIAARLAGVPLLWHVHDRIAEDYLPRLAVLVLRRAARSVPAGVIANSDATLASLRLPAGSARPLARVVGNVCPIVEDAPAERRDCGRPLVVGMVGRLAPWKGQDVFLRGFARAFPAGEQQAVIVGDALFGEDDYVAGLHHLAADLGIADRVRFAGFVPNPWVEMAGFDVLVHASVLPEPFGQVVVEGMALGCCVVATGVGGPAEIVTDGVDGLLVPPGDDGELARTLRRLDTQPTLRRSLQRAAPASVRRFGPAAVAAEEQGVYDELRATNHTAILAKAKARKISVNS